MNISHLSAQPVSESSDAPPPARHVVNPPSVLAPFFQSPGAHCLSDSQTASSSAVPAPPVTVARAQLPSNATNRHMSVTEPSATGPAQLTSSPAKQNRPGLRRKRPVGPFQASASQFRSRTSPKPTKTRPKQPPHTAATQCQGAPDSAHLPATQPSLSHMQPLASSGHSMHAATISRGPDVPLLDSTSHLHNDSRDTKVNSLFGLSGPAPPRSSNPVPAAALTAIAEGDELRKASFPSALRPLVSAPAAMPAAPVDSSSGPRTLNSGGSPQPLVLPVPPHLRARTKPTLPKPPAPPTEPQSQLAASAVTKQPPSRKASPATSCPTSPSAPAPIMAASATQQLATDAQSSPAPGQPGPSLLPSELWAEAGLQAGELRGRYRMPVELLHTHHGGMILPLPDRPQRAAAAARRRQPPPLLSALRVHSVTWNMGRTKPTHDIAAHLRGEFLGVAVGAAGGGATGATVPDVIVVGTQENAAPGPWLDLLQGVLRPEGYVLLRGAASMNSAPGGSFVMTVAAFVRRELEDRFSDVRVGRVTCGLGNKVRPQREKQQRICSPTP